MLWGCQLFAGQFGGSYWDCLYDMLLSHILARYVWCKVRRLSRWWLSHSTSRMDICALTMSNNWFRSLAECRFSVTCSFCAFWAICLVWNPFKIVGLVLLALLTLAFLVMVVCILVHIPSVIMSMYSSSWWFGYQNSDLVVKFGFTVVETWSLVFCSWIFDNMT